MAGDWIKVEKSTARKPEVLRIAQILNVTFDHAFGLCFRFWCWCDDNLENGHAKNVTCVTLDSLLLCDGFANSLVEVGWLLVREGSLVVPNYDRHLSKNAKNRALSAGRKQKERSRKCHDSSVTKTRPEKRREENILDISDDISNKTATKFLVPTLEEIRKYCEERKNSVDPKRFMSHYESNGWMVGKNKMKDWKAAVRTWEGNNYEQSYAKRGQPRDVSGGSSVNFDGNASGGEAAF